MFHKILKSGCRAEEAKLRIAQRLANLIAVYCILSWRVFWMTMLNRSSPAASLELDVARSRRSFGADSSSCVTSILRPIMSSASYCLPAPENLTSQQMGTSKSKESRD
ncbi:MAG: hypothetical protein Q8M19_18540 [Reyranella sp.]|nr:hypothetical protein [Reyranella sp.]